MMYAVIDTNILVSALMAKDPEVSKPFKIMSFALSGIIIPILTPEILNEYQDVLLRSKFNFDPPKVQTLIEELINCGIVVEPTAALSATSDFDDQCFLDAYEFCSAKNPYLITGNKKHFPSNNCIVSATEICEIINQHMRCL